MNKTNLLPSSVLQRPDERRLALRHVLTHGDEDLLLDQPREGLFRSPATTWPRSGATHPVESHGSSSFLHCWNWSHQSHLPKAQRSRLYRKIRIHQINEQRIRKGLTLLTWLQSETEYRRRDWGCSGVCRRTVVFYIMAGFGMVSLWWIDDTCTY